MTKEFVCMSPKSIVILEYLKGYYGDYGKFTEENYQIFIEWEKSTNTDSILNEIRIFGLGVYAALKGEES